VLYVVAFGPLRGHVGLMSYRPSEGRKLCRNRAYKAFKCSANDHKRSNGVSSRSNSRDSSKRLLRHRSLPVGRLGKEEVICESEPRR
jgi:hypothetical protein